MERKTTVIKAGGSCLVNGRALAQVNQQILRIKERGITPVIVVSAFKGMTDSLLDISVNGQLRPNPKMVDQILSEGEQMAARIMQTTLESAGLKVRALLLSDPDFPIITDAAHGLATILLEETENKIREVLIPLLDRGIIPIIPGFVGKTPRGDITTIGRGGSDTTAIVIGKALKSEEVLLLKDVPGILSGDPRMVDAPEQLSRITVEECLDLAIKGGEVVCPFSLIYNPNVVKLRVVNYTSEDLPQGGTTIDGEIEQRIKVDVKENKAAVTVVGKKMNELLGLLADFSSTLSGEGINIYSVLTSSFSISFYVDEDQRKKALNLLHGLVLRREELSSVISISHISIITVIGKTLATQLGTLEKIASALSKENIKLIDVNTTMKEVNLFVDQGDVKKAKRVLEALF